MIEEQPRDPGLLAAIEAAGTMTELAERINVTRSAISQWRKIPAERVIQVERASGVRREVLRPDLYTDEESAA